MIDTHCISTNSFHRNYFFFEFVNCSKFKYLPKNHLHKSFFLRKLFVEIQYLYYVCTLLLSKKSDCEAQSNVHMHNIKFECFKYNK